jgi:hypothetical protein
MNRERVVRLLAVVLVAALWAGCSSSGEELGPDETVEHVAQGLAEGRPVVMWQALPASYQKDVTGLVHQFAEKMDRDLWNQTFEVLAKLTRLLKEKRELILQHPLVAQKVADSDSTDVDGDWEGIVEVIDLLATSELADLDELAKLDVEAFLNGTGERFVRQIAAASSLAPEGQVGDYLTATESLRAVKATVVSRNGDQATVRIEQPGEDPRTEPLVRVEGKWIPADLADGWKSQMAQARESLSKMSGEQMQQNKQAVLLQLSMVEAALDTLLAAQTADQFNAGIATIMGGVMGMALQAAMNQGMEMTADESGGSPGAVFTMPPAAPSPHPAAFPGFPPAPPMPPEHSLESEPWPVEPTQPAPRKDPLVISVGQAHRFIGWKLRVVAADGLDTVAKLTEVDGDVLSFEQPLGGGVMSFKVRKQEVESLRAAH